MRELDRIEWLPDARARSAAVGAAALGVLAVGAVAIGALAVARLAIGRLSAKEARFGKVEIDELTVRRLRVLDAPPQRQQR